MKKFVMLFVAVVLSVTGMYAGDKVVKGASVLPQAAKQFLKTNFSRQKIHHVKVDKKFLSTSDYEVVLSNGTEVDFDSRGNWKEVDCGYNAVPDALLLRNMRSYIKSAYPGKKVVKIEKDRNEYDVELSNGVDLVFNRDGSFRRVDD